MSFLLSENRENDFHGYWKRYEEYLKAEGHRMPPGALKLALSSDWYDFSVHSCPHDSRLDECKIREVDPEPGGETPFYCSLEITLLGGFQNGKIHLRYPRLHGCNIQSADCEHGMGDWLYDEFRISDKGHLLHEIEWAEGGRWLIEADDIEFEWRPFETVTESK